MVETPPTTHSLPPPGHPSLGVWMLRLAAAPLPLLYRRDRPFDPDLPAHGVPDVIRYAAGARQALQGPLALQIEGPGDPLASPETVLRSLALLHDHHPDVLTGLVVDGPLLNEYADDLADFGLRYLVLRMDAAELLTARRLVDGAAYRGDRLDRDAAAELYLESGPQALCVAERVGIPTIVRLTLVPTVNATEVETIAVRARDAGATRMRIASHRPVSGSPLEHSGTPTSDELEIARRTVAEVFAERPVGQADDETLAWLDSARLQHVDTDELDAADVLRGLPRPDEEPVPAPVLPPRRAQLVAVATRDGTLVDTPLAATHLLRIYAVTRDSIRLIGSRALPLDPRRRQDGVGSAPAFLQAVVGCRAVVATHVPARAATLLQAVGVRPVAQGGTVEEVLDRVARGTVQPPEADAP